MIANSARQMKTQRLRIDGANYVLAAGQTDVDSDEVDSAGFECVEFEIHVGTMAASSDIAFQVQQSAVSGSGFADLEGSEANVTDADDNKIVRITVIQPRERYLRVQSIRGAGGNSTIDSMSAHLVGARKEPITDHATVLSSLVLHSPAEGTP
jgi:hypothetical protein